MNIGMRGDNMKLELTLDNGIKHSLYIPIELFNINTHDFICDTLKRWLEENSR